MLRLLVGLLMGAGETPRVECFQAAPPGRGAFRRSADKTLAVVLLPGLDVRDDGACPSCPRFQAWQGSTSPLVRCLAKHADVFSIGYAQITPVEEVAGFPELHNAIGRIRGLGYDRIVLVGHSCGGLVARHLVEDYSGNGISRVIQVATPNGGAALADWSFVGAKYGIIPKAQAPFVASLGAEYRTRLLAGRAGKEIPRSVEFVTILARMTSSSAGDGVLSKSSQWSRDLHLQGIPCLITQAKHTEVVEHDGCLELLCTAVTGPCRRWGRHEVFAMRKELGLAGK